MNVTPQRMAASARRFSLRHAYAMLGALALALLSGRCLAIAAISVVSLAAWVWELRGAFARPFSFGAANAVTSVRALSLFHLGASIDAEASTWAAASTMWIFTLDGIDGWLARRSGTASAFGALYDSETDASFMLLLSAGVFQLGRAGPWVLIAGLLRFVYVLVLHWSRRPEGQTKATRLRRYVFSIAVTSFALCLWPPGLGSASAALTAFATLLLTYSFSLSFRASFARRAPAVCNVR